jgi:rubrerythrin
MHATHTHPPGGCDTDALNALLRGELSAVETYDQAAAKFEDQKVLADLRKIRDEHARAAGALREKVVRFGAEPSEGSGPWGAVAAAVTGAAKALGPSTALSALRQGEEHGINEYEDALKNDGVHPDCKDLIRTDLLPKCRGHVEELNRLMGGMK